MPIEIDANRPSLPPAELIGQPEIRAAVEAYVRARADTFTAQRDATALEQTRPTAVERDRQAYADALDRNPRAKDPGTPAADRHDAQVDAARRHAAALAAIETRRFDALVTALETHGDDWGEMVGADEHAASADYTRAVDQLDAAFVKLVQVRAMAEYVRPRSEGQTARYNPAIAGNVNLPRSSESRAGVGQLIEAVRSFAEPRAPPAPTYSGGLRVAGAA